MTGLVGGAYPARKVLTLVHAIVAGASHIDHADVLRAGSSGGVWGHRVIAASTLGTFPRAFSFGHFRQLEAVVGLPRLHHRLPTGPSGLFVVYGSAPGLDESARRRARSGSCRWRSRCRERERRFPIRPTACRVPPHQLPWVARSGLAARPGRGRATSRLEE
jgi:hypothetical protein